MKRTQPVPYVNRIAIDGPAGSGKSVIGGMLGQHLGYIFIDAGVLYRAVTKEVLEKKVDPHDAAAAAEIAQSLSFIASMISDGNSVLRVNGKLVREDIYNAEVNAAVAVVAAYPEVRAIIREKQHVMARLGRLVFAGRDIGTVVMPDAELKIFLNVSLDTRAYRRHKSLIRNGFEVTLEEVRSQLEQRDHLDMNRAESPLRPADDAIIVNSGSMKIHDLLNLLIDHATLK
jgi:CMP/dCMP kinase